VTLTLEILTEIPFVVNFPISSHFCDVVFNLNLVQMIDEPTHIAGNILDLILTNVPDSISNLRIHCEPPFPIPSDHIIITFDFNSSLTSNRNSAHKDTPTLNFSMRIYVIFYITLILHLVSCLMVLNLCGHTLVILSEMLYHILYLQLLFGQIINPCDSTLILDIILTVNVHLDRNLITIPLTTVKTNWPKFKISKLIAFAEFTNASEDLQSQDLFLLPCTIIQLLFTVMLKKQMFLMTTFILFSIRLSSIFSQLLSPRISLSCWYHWGWCIWYIDKVRHL